MLEGRPVERCCVDAAKRYSHAASTGRSPYVERRSATTKLAHCATRRLEWRRAASEGAHPARASRLGDAVRTEEAV